MEGGIFMNKNEQVEYQVLEDFRQGRISRSRASELLGVSQRAISRRVKRIREKGMSGIKHGNFERIPANKTAEPIRREALSLIRERYYDFNISHAQDIGKQDQRPRLRVDRGAPNTSKITTALFVDMTLDLPSLARVRRPTDNSITERFYHGQTSVSL